MSDETQDRSSRGSKLGPGHGDGGPSHESPLLARAPFLQNWSWESVTDIARRTCAGGKADYGPNAAAFDKVAAAWRATAIQELSLIEAYDFLCGCHREQPFLFFNGNTFSSIARVLTETLFADLPPARIRAASSLVGHYVAGVLDRQPMIAGIEDLSRAPAFRSGMRVKTLKGSLGGRVVEVKTDGKVFWVADTGARLLAAPETLLEIE